MNGEGTADQRSSPTKRASDAPLPLAVPDAEPAIRRHALDAQRYEDLHRRLMALYERELSRQTEARAEMDQDDRFYDNEQWTEAEKAALAERGQVALVFNVISTAVDWIIGTEKRGRTDYKILPRRKDASRAAERKTQIFKYLEDANNSPFHRSRAFKDATKVGIGWLEAGIQGEDDREPIYDSYVSWRHMLWDTAAIELDLSDARYQFRVKWVDLDAACALFPERKGLLYLSAMEGDRYRSGNDLLHGDTAMDAQEDALEEGTFTDYAFSTRRRVRLIECWYRQPVPSGKKMAGGDFAGEVYDPYSPGHVEAVEGGQARIISRPMMRMRVAIMTARGLLYEGESPYRHNQFPFTPIWCYRRGWDNMPYGVIRRLRDIQRDINKRNAKALAILSSNKVVMDEGAVDDLDKFAQEVSRPDAIIVKKQGKELQLSTERELAAPHIELMSRGIAMIQQVSGVTDEAMGRTTNAVAGVAIQARQQQAGMATAELFDNLRFAVKVHGEKKLSVIEQFLSEEKSFRITNQRGTPEYVTINDGLPENDIVRSKADFIISEDDWRATTRQAQVAELMDLLGKMVPMAPQLATLCLDLLVESMDIPNRDELVKRIRQATGMRDPDAEEPTPEEIAQAQAQQAQQELQQRAIMAKVAADEAQAMLRHAQAQKVGAEMQLAAQKLVGDNVEAQKAALEAALLAISNPVAAAVGDRILHESGFQGRTEQEEDARAMGMMQGEEQARQQQMQEQQAAAQQQQAQAEQASQQQQRSIRQALDQMNPTQREEAQRQMAEQAMQQQAREATQGPPPMQGA